MSNEQKELSEIDKALAINVANVDMFVINKRHRITGKIMESDHYMVILTAKGKKYVFKQQFKSAPKMIVQ